MHEGIWRKNIPGRKNRAYKCLGAETCLTYWRNAKEFSVTGPLKIKRRVARDVVRAIE